MSAILGGEDSSSLNVETSKISDETLSVLQEDEVVDLVSGMDSSGSESSDSNNEDVSSCSTTANTDDSARRIAASAALEELGEAISCDSDNNNDNSKHDAFVKANKATVEKELEEGELESDSDVDEPIEVKEEEPISVGVGVTRLSFESRFRHQQTPSAYSPTVSAYAPHSKGVCRYFLRGMCTWGDGCKYFHPPSRADGGSRHDNSVGRPLSSYHSHKFSSAFQQSQASNRRSTSSMSSREDINIHKRVSSVSVSDDRPILDDDRHHRVTQNHHRNGDRRKSRSSSSSSSTATSFGSHSDRRRHHHRRHGRSEGRDHGPSVYARRGNDSRRNRRSHSSSSRGSTISSAGSRLHHLRRHRRSSSGRDNRKSEMTSTAQPRNITANGDGSRRESSHCHTARRRSTSSDEKRHKRNRKRKSSSGNGNADSKTRRMTTPNVEPISSDSDGIDDPSELKLRNTLGAELRRTTSRDSAARGSGPAESRSKQPRLHA